MIYNILVFPFETAFKFLYTAIYSITGSYGMSLILMSVCTSVLISPFMKYANRAQAREKHTRDVLGVQIEKINSESTGAERHKRIVDLYGRYSYHPIYSIRSAAGVLLQVPFLLAAYYMLSNFTAIQGQSFLFIKNLAAPDLLLFGKMNLLPILMTVINIAAAITTPNFSKKDIIQAMVIALLFLVLLYDAPSALLIFWTFNNFWVLLGNYKEFSKIPASIRNNFSIPPAHFWGMAYVALFLITLQANVAFFFGNELDIKQGLFALFFGLTLFTFASIYIVGSEKKFSSKIAVLFALFIILGFWILWLATSSELERLSVFVKIPDALRELGVNIKMGIEGQLGLHPSQVLSLLQFVLSSALMACFRKQESRFVGQNYGNYYFALLMCVIAPATFQLGNNLAYAAASTVWIYYAALISLGFAVCFCLRFLFAAVVRQENMFIISCAFIFALILNPTVQAMFKFFGSTSIAFIPNFLIVLFIALTFGKKFGKSIAVLLVVATLSSVVGICFSDDVGNVSGNVPERKSGMELVERGAEKLVQIQPHERVNVYMLVYDSTSDIKTLENLGVDSTPLSALLNSHKFKLYDDTYTLFPQSLPSMSTTFSIGNTYKSAHEAKRACGGDAISFEIFSRNAYKTCWIQNSYMTGSNVFVDEHFPPLEKISSEIDSIFLLIRGILAGEFRFDAVGISSTPESEYHQFLRAQAANREVPGLTVMHVGAPGHSQNSGRLLPNETEFYIERFKSAIVEIRKDLDAIITNDPSAVIVVMGDHGPYLTGDGLFLAGYASESLTELMIRDRFGTLIAIRWPDTERAAKYDKNLLVNQDIFPVVFAYLADSAEPLKLMIKDKKAYLKGHAFLDNGVFIPYK